MRRNSAQPSPSTTSCLAGEREGPLIQQDPRTLGNERWRKMVEAAELPDLRFRDLRRDAMISLLNSSVDVVTVRFVGGYLN